MTQIEQIRNPKQRAFLAAFMQVANISRAAQIAEVDRTSHYVWLHGDGEYSAAFEQAKEVACDALEDEAVRRAHEGVDEPVFYQGEKCGTVRKYSDTLLIFLMKGAMPEKYKDNWKGEIGGAGGEKLEGIKVVFVKAGEREE